MNDGRALATSGGCSGGSHRTRQQTRSRTARPRHAWRNAPRGSRRPPCCWLALAFAGAVAQTGRSNRRSRSPVREPTRADGVRRADRRHGSHPAVCRVAGWPVDGVCRRPGPRGATLWLRSLDDVDARALPGTDDASRAVLVAGQPLDWVLRRPGQAEEGCRVGRRPSRRSPATSRILAAPHGALTTRFCSGQGLAQSTESRQRAGLPRP